MIDISKKIGLPIKFNESSLDIIYDNKIVFYKTWEKRLDSSTIPDEPVWKSMKFASQFTDDNGKIIKQPDLKRFYLKDRLYFGFNGFYLNDKDLLKQISDKEIIPDITIIPPGTIEDEYIRTEGHEHLSQLPEIYEVILGKAVFLLFKPDEKNKEDIKEILAVFADVGDHVIFPSGYHHISINISSTPLVLTDFNSKKANSDFRYIKKHNGAPYWLVKKNNRPEFIKNPKYNGIIPEIRKVLPIEEIKEFNLKKGEPMFNLIKDKKIDSLDFLNDVSKLKKIKYDLFTKIN